MLLGALTADDDSRYDEFLADSFTSCAIACFSYLTRPLRRAESSRRFISGRQALVPAENARPLFLRFSFSHFDAAAQMPIDAEASAIKIWLLATPSAAILLSADTCRCCERKMASHRRSSALLRHFAAGLMTAFRYFLAGRCRRCA